MIKCMKKILLKKAYKGLTLIEVLVALFVFAIIMVAASQIFAKAFSGYRNTRATQRDVENAQYALNLITKELRTSTVVGPLNPPFPRRSNYVKFYDHSQGKCFYYRINSSSLQVASATVSGGIPECRSRNFTTFSTISTGAVTGSFRVTPSCSSVLAPPACTTDIGGGIGAKRVGKVTISLDISEDTTHRARIQTTASLRDFGNIGFQ